MESSRTTAAAPAVPRWLPAGAALAAAGWGANQFTPLAAVYRTQEQWHPVLVAVLFTAYLPGLLPGLLLGGPAADRYGRRRVVRAALLLSAAASALPAAAASSPPRRLRGTPRDRGGGRFRPVGGHPMAA
ncbi:MFS transporter [Streptomyces albidoflavus]